MVAIIVDKHIHRLLSNGIVESANLDIPDNGGLTKICNDWEQTTPEVVDLTGAEQDEIKRTLVRLTAVFYEGRTVPKQPVIKNAVAGEQVTVR